MQAMILAAGFGTRLLPYTTLRPKPLFPLCNEPLLLLTIKRLQHAGFDHIIVNCHHLKEQVVAALSELPGVIVQEEISIMGTGGGLRMALDSMRNEPLLVTNSDIYHFVDYQLLYHHHLTTGSPVTMAMHNFPRFNKVVVKGGKVASFAAKSGSYTVAFTGIHVLQPDVLTAIAKTRKSSIIDRYQQLLSSGGEISAYDVSAKFWTDMGTVADYLELHGKVLTGEVALWPESSILVKSPFVCLHADVQGQCHDWACIGDVQVPDGVRFTRCVVWDGAQLTPDTHYIDTLVV